MPIELARKIAMSRPWGVVRPLHGQSIADFDGPLGEIWFERPGTPTPIPSLLLKLLLTSQPLSIQVHPGDAFARSKGLPNGKSEAWYVLNAAPGAQVGLGLSQTLSHEKLRRSVENGSIQDLVRWQKVCVDDVINVPAGTIHAIGAGLVIAEIQQRSDATFRMFDFGRNRPLHVDDALSVAIPGPAGRQARSRQITEERARLVENEHFVLERIDLLPNTRWQLDAERETWIFILSGAGKAGHFDVKMGDAIFAQADRVEVQPGSIGLEALVAYAGPDLVPNLLQPLDAKVSIRASPLQEATNPPRMIATLSRPEKRRARVTP